MVSQRTLSALLGALLIVGMSMPTFMHGMNNGVGSAHGAQDTRNHYEVLGVAHNATTEEITAAHKRLSKIHHPDRGGDAEEMKKINAARDVLSDPTQRSTYNNTLHAQQQAPARTSPASTHRNTYDSETTRAQARFSTRLYTACTSATLFAATCILATNYKNVGNYLNPFARAATACAAGLSAGRSFANLWRPVDYPSDVKEINKENKILLAMPIFTALLFSPGRNLSNWSFAASALTWYMEYGPGRKN